MSLNPRNRTLSPASLAFLAKHPTLIGTVAGISFYEHPEYGDEMSLCVIVPDGRFLESSGFCDLPDGLAVMGVNWEAAL